MIVGGEENSNMAQLNPSDAATSDQIIPGDLVVSTRIHLTVIISFTVFLSQLNLISYVFPFRTDQ